MSADSFAAFVDPAGLAALGPGKPVRHYQSRLPAIGEVADLPASLCASCPRVLLPGTAKKSLERVCIRYPEMAGFASPITGPDIYAVLRQGAGRCRCTTPKHRCRQTS